MEDGGSGHLSRWTGDQRLENKEGNQVHKERCSSVSGWQIRGGVRTLRLTEKDIYYSWKSWGGVS